MYTYQAQVRLPNGSVSWVTVQANSVAMAREMVKAQYGNVLSCEEVRRNAW
jgi:hypothetical protein